MEEDLQHNEPGDALNLKWVVGFNKDIVNGVHNLTSEDRTEIFYTAAHTGVIYNYETREQRLLQGHCNQVNCCVVSPDKKWIITADRGKDSLMVVWDSLTATPVRTIFSPHGEGVHRIDVSSDGRFIATLSNSFPQEIAIWDWSAEAEETEELMIVAGDIPNTHDPEHPERLHHSIRFNPSNSFEFASNSSESVLFWQWDDSEQTLKYEDNEKEMKFFFRQKMEPLTQTVFIPDTSQAVSGTKNGRIVVWDVNNLMESEDAVDSRKPIKVVQLVNREVTFLLTQGEYLVVGSRDGAVRFYDKRYTVEAWFEHISAENITSISFANLPPRRSTDELSKVLNSEDSYSPEKDSGFACPDFVVASNNAKIISLKSTYFEEVPPVGEENFVQGETLIKGMKYPVLCCALHPKKPLMALAGGRHDSKNYIHIWNYETRTMEKDSSLKSEKTPEDENAQPLCMEYSSEGNFLCVGLSNGNFLLLDAENPDKSRQDIIKYTENPKAVVKIAFSPDGNAMAIAEVNHRVTLFRWEYRRGNPDLNKEWVFCGSHKSHYKQVTGICFGESVDEKEETVLRLFTVGDDRKLIEYDTSSTDTTQLQIVSMNKIEQECKPTNVVWYPVSTGEDLLLTINDAHKIKLWNPNNKDCRLTCLGPTSGGAVTKIKLVSRQKEARTAIDEPDYYLAYSTDEKIIGLIKMPVDGNPNKNMGLIGHPGKISDIVVSADQRHLFTAGREDLCVNMWEIDADSLERQVLLGGEGMEPFEEMIEGGKYGKPYKDMKDFFYYSQIRSKTENTTKTRKLEGSVPLDEVGYLMSAMGYYPSKYEIENMKNEVKYSKFTETGKTIDSLDIDTLLKVFVNHRPVYADGEEEIKEAFNLISSNIGAIPKEDLFDLLKREGEPMNDKELRSCLESLLPESEGNPEDQIPNEVTPEFFIEKILGFEEIAEEEFEGESQIIEVETE